MTFSIMALVLLCWVLLCWMSFMLSVSNMHFMLNVIMLIVVMLSVIMLSVVVPKKRAYPIHPWTFYYLNTFYLFGTLVQLGSPRWCHFGSAILSPLVAQFFVYVRSKKNIFQFILGCASRPHILHILVFPLFQLMNTTWHNDIGWILIGIWYPWAR